MGWNGVWWLRGGGDARGTTLFRHVKHRVKYHLRFSRKKGVQLDSRYECFALGEWRVLCGWEQLKLGFFNI